MKIIHRGEVPSERVYTVTCNYCSSIVEFVAHEGKTTYDQREGSYITFKCPVCGSPIMKEV